MKYFTFLIFALNGLVSCAQIDHQNLLKKVNESYNFAKKNKMDTSICILVDMRIHSGNKRLFVYDFQQDSIILDGLCTHGSGSGQSENSNDKPVFSNIPDSHCSSLGKYKIGSRGYSSWGIHVNYKLHGLESTNNKAFERFIVLHSWEWVSDDETFPQGSPQSWGCPAVSNNIMVKLDDLLKSKKRPVLLWIYNN